MVHTYMNEILTTANYSMLACFTEAVLTVQVLLQRHRSPKVFNSWRVKGTILGHANKKCRLGAAALQAAHDLSALDCTKRQGV